MSENIFEKATRLKLRFPYKGSVSTEDLWDISPTGLDGIYKELRNSQKSQEGDSLLATKRTDTVLNLKITVVTYIVGVKVEEQNEAKLRAEKTQKKARVMEILAQKQDDALRSKSVDELQKLLED